MTTGRAGGRAVVAACLAVQVHTWLTCSVIQRVMLEQGDGKGSGAR